MEGLLKPIKPDKLDDMEEVLIFMDYLFKSLNNESNSDLDEICFIKIDVLSLTKIGRAVRENFTRLYSEFFDRNKKIFQSMLINAIEYWVGRLKEEGFDIQIFGEIIGWAEYLDRYEIALELQESDELGEGVDLSISLDNAEESYDIDDERDDRTDEINDKFGEELLLDKLRKCCDDFTKTMALNLQSLLHLINPDFMELIFRGFECLHLGKNQTNLLAIEALNNFLPFHFREHEKAYKDDRKHLLSILDHITKFISKVCYIDQREKYLDLLCNLADRGPIYLSYLIAENISKLSINSTNDQKKSELIYILLKRCRNEDFSKKAGYLKAFEYFATQYHNFARVIALHLISRNDLSGLSVLFESDLWLHFNTLIGLYKDEELVTNFKRLDSSKIESKNFTKIKAIVHLIRGMYNLEDYNIKFVQEAMRIFTNYEILKLLILIQLIIEDKNIAKEKTLQAFDCFQEFIPTSFKNYNSTKSSMIKTYFHLEPIIISWKKDFDFYSQNIRDKWNLANKKNLLRFDLFFFEEIITTMRESKMMAEIQSIISSVYEYDEDDIRHLILTNFYIEELDESFTTEIKKIDDVDKFRLFIKKFDHENKQKVLVDCLWDMILNSEKIDLLDIILEKLIKIHNQKSIKERMVEKRKHLKLFQTLMKRGPISDENFRLKLKKVIQLILEVEQDFAIEEFFFRPHSKVTTSCLYTKRFYLKDHFDRRDNIKNHIFSNNLSLYELRDLIRESYGLESRYITKFNCDQVEEIYRERNDNKSRHTLTLGNQPFIEYKNSGFVNNEMKMLKGDFYKHFRTIFERYSRNGEMHLKNLPELYLGCCGSCLSFTSNHIINYLKSLMTYQNSSISFEKFYNYYYKSSFTRTEVVLANIKAQFNSRGDVLDIYNLKGDYLMLNEALTRDPNTIKMLIDMMSVNKSEESLTFYSLLLKIQTSKEVFDKILLLEEIKTKSLSWQEFLHSEYPLKSCYYLDIIFYILSIYRDEDKNTIDEEARLFGNCNILFTKKEFISDFFSYGGLEFVISLLKNFIKEKNDGKEILMIANRALFIVSIYLYISLSHLSTQLAIGVELLSMNLLDLDDFIKALNTFTGKKLKGPFTLNVIRSRNSSSDDLKIDFDSSSWIKLLDLNMDKDLVKDIYEKILQVDFVELCDYFSQKFEKNIIYMENKSNKIISKIRKQIEFIKSGKLNLEPDYQIKRQHFLLLSFKCFQNFEEANEYLNCIFSSLAQDTQYNSLLKSVLENTIDNNSMEYRSSLFTFVKNFVKEHMNHLNYLHVLDCMIILAKLSNEKISKKQVEKFWEKISSSNVFLMNSILESKTSFKDIFDKLLTLYEFLIKFEESINIKNLVAILKFSLGELRELKNQTAIAQRLRFELLSNERFYRILSFSAGKVDLSIIRFLLKIIFIYHDEERPSIQVLRMQEEVIFKILNKYEPILELEKILMKNMKLFFRNWTRSPQKNVRNFCSSLIKIIFPLESLQNSANFMNFLTNSIRLFEDSTEGNPIKLENFYQFWEEIASLKLEGCIKLNAKLLNGIIRKMIKTSVPTKITKLRGIERLINLDFDVVFIIRFVKISFRNNFKEILEGDVLQHLDELSKMIKSEDLKITWNRLVKQNFDKKIKNNL